MKQLFIITFCLFTIKSFAQPVKEEPTIKYQLKDRIINFLNWYKKEESKASKRDYKFIKGGYPDTTTKPRIDADAIEKYLQVFAKSGYVSEVFTDGLRNYFMRIDASLEKMGKTKALTKLPGMDVDFILQDYEPDAIFDNIDKSTIKKCYVIANKALISLHVTPNADLLVGLTNRKNTWLIDYIGYDADNPRSFFTQ